MEYYYDPIIGYYKPIPTTMTREEFEQIRNTPKPDDAALDAEARELEKKFWEIRLREEAQKNAAAE